MNVTEINKIYIFKVIHLLKSGFEYDWPFAICFRKCNSHIFNIIHVVIKRPQNYCKNLMYILVKKKKHPEGI